MIKEELQDILLDNISKDGEHKHYERVCKVAKFAHQINTGLDQREFVVCYRTESEKQKESRVKLTNSYTPFIAGQIESVYKKADRSDNVKKSICHTDEVVLKRINNKTKHFKGKKSFENYIHQRLRYYYFNDPNAWMLFERKKITDSFGDIKDFQFYPFEVSSKQAKNYSEVNGVVNWLIVEHQKETEQETGLLTGYWNKKPELYDKHIQEQKEKKKTKYEKAPEEKETELKIYYIYAAGWVIQAEEYKEKELPEVSGDNINTVLYKTENKTAGRHFQLRFFENGSKEFPGIRTGNIPDLLTKGETFVTPLQKARGILLDIIRDKSFLDITKAKHTFLQKMTYGQPCDYVHTDHGPCAGGCYEDTKIDCQACKGSGQKWHMTDQEIISVQLPEGDNVTPVPLETFATYIRLPTETPQFLSDQLYKELALVEQAVFNTQVLQNPVFGKTATEVVQLNENVYDALWEFGVLISEAYCTGIRICAQYLGKETGLEVDHKFGRDFRLKDTATRIQDYRAAKEAGIDAKTLQELGYRVTGKVFQNDPVVLSEIKAFDCFKPFADKSIEEIAFILTDRSQDDDDRVLYENFDRIVKEITYDLNKGQIKKVHFSDLTIEKQKELVQAKTNEFKGSITPIDEIEEDVNNDN
mgnify:CR=1 FL=1